MTSITGGTQSPTYTTDATTLNRQETYDLRDAARYGDQLADVLGDLIASRRADGSANVDSTATISHRNLHPDDNSLQKLIQRAASEGGPLANFLNDSTLAASVRSGQALTFDEASALLDQVQSWSSTVRDSLPGTKHNSGLTWDRTTHSFNLDGRRVSLFEAYSEIRLKQADEIQTALAERANSLDLRNRNIKALGDFANALRDHLANDPLPGNQSYQNYVNGLNTDFENRFGVSLLSQLGTQGITSFFSSGSNADDDYVESIVEAVEKQQESLQNDNAIAAQQNQRLEDQLRIVYTSISSFTSSDTAVAGSAGRQI